MGDFAKFKTELLLCIMGCLYLFLLLMGCDKPSIDCEYPDYSECVTQEPKNGKLKIKITINGENKSVPIVIYYGRIEHDAVCLRDTLNIKEQQYTVPADVYYAVKATYKSGNRTIHAVDGGYLEKKSYLVCDSTCWVVKDVDLNLKLQY
ncbi:MAG: hypothetical protein BWY70_00782 [Bacteroidetes bacterium ADurb.Bin408]|nr:MAG: hypothetical protein BWY70_00782 [Bacteroidetes bacterium ADurb.Bin408]